MSLQLMKERIKQSGFSLYEEQIKDAQDILLYGFQDDVSYNPNIIVYKSNLKLPIKIYNQKFSATYGFTANFLSPNSFPVELGEILYDNKKDEYWLCVESYNISNIHNEGKLGKCARFLKWQDENGIIQREPTIVTTASKYNNGENRSEIMRLGSDQLMLFMQSNENTIKIDRGTKFFIDENKRSTTVYEITRNDTALYTYMGKGFLSIIATECSYTPTKKELELGVCEYKNFSSSISSSLNPNEKRDLLATISGNTTLKVGIPRTYMVNFTDKNNNPINWNQINFKWNILSDFKINLNTINNEVELWVDDEKYINNTFLLQILVNNTLLSETKITVTDLV